MCENIRTSPAHIIELADNQVFVFGSNDEGAHFGGAAAFAVRKFGAVMGQAEGLQGQSYAINTMDGLDVMREQIAKFIKFARVHKELEFLVTELGCGIAGYQPEDIAPLFGEVKEFPDNVLLPQGFVDVMSEQANERTR